MSEILDVAKKFLGDKVVTFFIIAAAGFMLAIEIPNFILTQEAFAQEKQKLEIKIDTNVAKLQYDMATLELSSLRKEKNDLLDLIDAGKAKPRHREALEEVKNRIKELEDNKKAYAKIINPK